MREFIAAVYNEAQEIDDLLNHIYPLVDRVNIVDDGSTDDTAEKLDLHYLHSDEWVQYKVIAHTGLPETVKNEALKMCQDGSWVIMLDADERFTDDTIYEIEKFFETDEHQKWDYIYFNQLEVIDQHHVRTFQKCKLFRKESVRFPLDNIHADDQFEGRGGYFGWEVIHRKTTNKQIQRETEYLATYKKLLVEGKIDEGRYNWLVGLHHYVKPKG